MFKNYLKIAFRNIKKYRSYSTLNVIGLSVGMACFILILSYVQNELSYDRFHEKRDQIYRLMRIEKIEEKTGESYGMPAPLAPALVSDFHEIKNTVRITGAGWIPIRYKDKSFVEKNFLMADPSFFEIFTFPLAQGNPQTPLPDKYSVVITEEIANKYFGDENPIGKIITYDNKIDLKVSGVVKNISQNTEFNFDLLIPFELIDEIQGYNYTQSWGAFNFAIYVLARKDINLSDFANKSLTICKNYRPNDTPDYQLLHSLFLQSITKTHLDSNTRLYIYIFSAIAMIILLLACINFMNLAIAQSSARSKEVGMRKVIGANRSQLIKQFLGESLVLSLIAFPLAIIIVEILRPLHNDILNINVSVNYIKNWQFSIGLIGVALLTGIISGSYPAFYTSAIQPVKSLRDNLRSGSRSTGIRNILVVFQFSISMILMISTMIIHGQLQYIRNKDLGFTRDHVINVILYDRALRQNYESFKVELLKNPRIVSASGNYFMSGGGNNSICWEGMNEGDEKMMRYFSVDPDFLETFQIELLEGRNFHQGSQSDAKYAYLLNESAVKELGWESAVGKQFEVQMYGSEMGKVVGVVKDFHFQSLRRKIEPLAMRMGTAFNIISLRILPDDFSGTIEFIGNKLKQFAPNAPYEYYFLDTDIDDMYESEERMGNIFNHFSIIAILIGCLGLLGLTSFAIIGRTKEIGVRKVLGASVTNITVLLTKQFTTWVLIANIFAWPVAYYIANRWLENFAYRISIELWIFLLASAVAFFIAIFTVSFQTIKAALMNPVKALRYE